MMVLSPWPQPISRMREPGGMEKEERMARRWVVSEIVIGDGDVGELELELSRKYCAREVACVVRSTSAMVG